MAGIVGYTGYIPYMRIRVEDIHCVWKNMPLAILKDVLKVNERTVLQPNEDTITLAIEAARGAIKHAGINREEIDALFLGTCTNPYDSKPSATVIAEAVDTSLDLMCADVQFSGKSGTTAMQICAALVDSKMAKVGLAIGSDTINRHTCPGKMYEYTASAGAAAFVIGNEKPIAEIAGTCSYATDLADFFRVEGDRYIQNIGVENIGQMGKLYPAWEIGFVDHVVHASERLMQKLDLKAEDYSFAVFQQPYGAIPFAIGEKLGLTEDQIEPGVIAPMVGDCGAASALLGLVNVLDIAKSGQRILVASYGFGAGSDAFSLEVMPAIEEKRSRLPLSRYLYERKTMVDYATACRCEYKYMQDSNPLFL